MVQDDKKPLVCEFLVAGEDPTGSALDQVLDSGGDGGGYSTVDPVLDSGGGCGALDKG